MMRQSLPLPHSTPQLSPLSPPSSSLPLPQSGEQWGGGDWQYRPVGRQRWAPPHHLLPEDAVGLRGGGADLGGRKGYWAAGGGQLPVFL